jgi:23S rRNA (cytidine1920-2'-O)/16S rRNA (cytidine1409-2'-O)-methyltransferase
MARQEKVRLDQLLVERGWAATREQAQRMIRAGQVRRGTQTLDKPGMRLEAGADLAVEPLHDRFVSRGGWKLEAAFETFPGLTPCPALCADVGASTGGFTDCLLQHGARRVYAIDVGTGQLDARLRADPRVAVMENRNARYLAPGDLPEPVDLVVADVSFISLKLILPPASCLLRPAGGQIVALVKPQFEAGPERVGKGGVVRDPKVHEEILRDLALDFVPSIGLAVLGLIPSPLLGPAGNREYLLWLANAALRQGAPRLDDAVRDAVRRAFEKK